MPLRFSFNSSLGPLIVENDPIGINDITQITKRSEQYEGVFYEIILNVEFIKEGRAYLIAAYEAGGIDAVVSLTLYDRNPNTRRWEHYFSGKINFNNYNRDEDKVSVNIEQAGIESRILNLIDTDVDLERRQTQDGRTLPIIKFHDVTYHSKVIVKELRLETAPNPGHSTRGVEYQEMDILTTELPTGPLGGNHDYELEGIQLVSLGLDEIKIDELNTHFSYPYASLETYSSETKTSTPNFIPTSSILITPAPKAMRNEVYRASESSQVGGMDVVIQLSYKHKITAWSPLGKISFGDSGSLGNVEVAAWFEHRDIENTIISLTKIGEFTGVKSENLWESQMQILELKYKNITVSIGDKFCVYETVRVGGLYVNDQTLGAFGKNSLIHSLTIQSNPEQTYISFQSKTVTEPVNIFTPLIYEVVKRCCQYYTNVDDCFYSELLGRTDILDSKGVPIYDVDGEASLIGWISGNKLRNNGKHILVNLKDVLDFLNARYCIGFGFEIIGNNKVFRIEKREHFYNKAVKILSLGPVYNIERKLINKMYWNQVEFGYSSKLDIGQTNATDEYNSIRRDTIPIVNTKNKLTISTKIHTSGNEIEYQKRLRGSQIDSKLDDENFPISLVRNGATFKTKTMEGYSKVNRVVSEDTQYNLDFAPAWMIRAWAPYIASCLIRSKSKLLKFSYGEVNYRLSFTTTAGETISEHADLNLSGIQPIFDPEEYSFSFRLTRDQMKILKANPYGYIEFEDKDGNVMEGFIHSDGGIEHDSNRGTAEFKLLKVNRVVLGESSELPRTDLLGLEDVEYLGGYKPVLIKGEPIDPTNRALLQYLNISNPYSGN